MTRIDLDRKLGDMAIGLPRVVTSAVAGGGGALQPRQL